MHAEAPGDVLDVASPAQLDPPLVQAVDPAKLSSALRLQCARKLLHLFSIREGQVRVEASSDGRGMFLDEGVSPGSDRMLLYFRIGAGKASTEQIESLVEWVEQHSPVAADITRAVEVYSELETV